MQTIRLSERALSAMGAGSPRVRDHRLPIIAVPAKSKTRISLYVIKRFTGHKSASWIKLGVWPEVSYQFAHEKALKVLASHANNETPSMAKDHADHTLETVGDVLRYALAKVDAENRLSSDRKRNVRSIITQHLLPALGDVTTQELTVDCVYQRLIITRQQYALSYVALMLRTLKQAFGMASHRVTLSSKPWNLALHTSARVRQKEAAYNTSQVSAVVEQIRAEPKPWLRVLLAWSLMYAVRVGEVSAMCWSAHIDVKRQIYRLPASLTKNKKEHQLPLTAQALMVLRAYKQAERTRGRRGDKLFPARRNPWKAINPSYASYVVSKALGAGSCHDLRKLARSWLLENGADNYVGRLILNQKQAVLDDTYVQKLMADKSRAALEMWHARLFDAGLFDALQLERDA